MTDETNKDRIEDMLDEARQAQPEGEAPAETEESQDQRLAELNDRLLRTLAEMENLRQRTRREVEDARRYAVTGFARELLDIADNLRRALASVPAEARGQDPFLENLVSGVEMTERALLAAFERHQIQKVSPSRGDKFDHRLHQAMFEQPTDELPPGTIAELMAPGYVIADRLLRPAMVGVAKALPGAASDGNGAAAAAQNGA